MNSRVIALLASEDPFVSHHWLFPETGEIIYGGLASVIVVGALVKFAGPMAKKSFAERTARIQKQLDDAAAAKVTADGDAKNIRAALGDVASERARILAEADINAARGRGSDELRNEITVLASRATPIVVAATMNEQIHKDLVENFISKVGAGR